MCKSLARLAYSFTFTSYCTTKYFACTLTKISHDESAPTYSTCKTVLYFNWISLSFFWSIPLYSKYSYSPATDIVLLADLSRIWVGVGYLALPVRNVTPLRSSKSSSGISGMAWKSLQWPPVWTLGLMAFSNRFPVIVATHSFSKATLLHLITHLNCSDAKHVPA